MKFEFENIEKNKIEMFCLESSDYRDTEARENKKDILVDYSSKGAAFWIEISMEEIELVVAENCNFEYSAK